MVKGLSNCSKRVIESRTNKQSVSQPHLIVVQSKCIEHDLTYLFIYIDIACSIVLR